MYLDVYNNHFRFIYNGQVQCEIACNSAGMTDNFFFGNYNKSGNGYNRLNNGFIIQWGTATGLSGYGYTTVTFPVTFSTCFTVVQTEYFNSDNAASGIRGVSWFNNAQARLGYENYGCTWIAIGV